jgi:hypothetical protein
MTNEFEILIHKSVPAVLRGSIEMRIRMCVVALGENPLHELERFAQCMAEYLLGSSGGRASHWLEATLLTEGQGIALVRDTDW